MRTILHINNSICSSLEQLRYFFSMELVPETPLYEDLLTLQRDGELTRWLAEGNTEEEKILARKINDLSLSTPNSELMEQLVKIFIKEDKLIRSSLYDYVDMVNVLLIDNERTVATIDSQNRDEILIEKKQLSSALVSIEMKVKKVDNELFDFRVTNKKNGHSEENRLSIEGLKHGTEISVRLPFPPVDYDSNEIEIISNSDCICHFNLFVVKSEKAYANLEDYRALRLGNIRLGLTTANDFHSEDNGKTCFKGANLIFHDGLLSEISAVKGTEAFRSLLVLLLNKEDTDEYAFFQIYNILMNKGFIPGKSSLKLKVVSKAFDTIIRPSSIMTRALFPYLSLAREAAANIVKGYEDSAIYKDELRKETNDYVCVLDFYSDKCTGYDDVDHARYKSGTLKSITIHKK